MTRTSEAPQDVAALPQTEAGKRLLNWSAYDGVARLEEILAIEREAAAGLLDQNDRLRSALRDANQIVAMTRNHLAADHPDCAYTALGVMNDAARAALADGIDAVFSSGRGSGAEEAARNG